MSMWTDRELKALIHRVNELERRLDAIEQSPNPAPAEFAAPPPDKRTREYREWQKAHQP